MHQTIEFVVNVAPVGAMCGEAAVYGLNGTPPGVAVLQANWFGWVERVPGSP